MNLCQFINFEGGVKCVACGFQINGLTTDKLIRRTCTSTPNPEYPSLFEASKNLVNAMIEFAKDGFKLEDEEEQKRRLEICTGNKEKGIPACPLYDATQNRCKECGCFVSWATAISSKHCPLGKW